MKKLPTIGTVYFLGIGGIGMSALARYFMNKGWKIHGYDRTPTSLTEILIQEGMEVHFEDNPDLIPDQVDLVVLTPAVPYDHQELQFFRNKGVHIVKRAELLGMISKEYRTIAVAGTHGKTTTSTMITHLLLSSRIGCTAFLGGISKNYETNFVLSDTSDLLVAEADEFDRSFLHLQPETAIITSMDADHLDIYGDHGNLLNTFVEFAGNIKDGGNLIMKYGLDLPMDISGRYSVYTYGLDQLADFHAENLALIDGLYHFDFTHPSGCMKDLVLGLPGKYNIENAVAALAICWLQRLSEPEVRTGLSSFKGVRRRFDIRVSKDRLVYIDDYAHHPEELSASISSARAMFSDRRITGIFQPHLFSRTRDFMDEFARSLELLDEVILLPIYPAREVPIPGISSDVLLSRIRKGNKKLVMKEELPGILDKNSLEVLMTLGAGDIDTLAGPIEKYLSE
jgi:UDP-N-acetylmuramate--alanine ligase